MVRIATRGFGLALTPLLVLFWGCGSSETRPTEAIGLVDTKTASGVYDVTGVTVQAANGLEREIAGTMRSQHRNAPERGPVSTPGILRLIG